MYCMNCGVKLADTEKCCPLCGVEAFHPDILREKAEPLYPQRTPNPAARSRAAQIVLTTFCLIAVLITLFCDLQINRKVIWSGYVMGALALAYNIFILPGWFRKPNPVVFVPCNFVGIGLYLLYINFVTDGNWFLSFAFPVTGGIGLIVTTVVVLLKYVRRGKLYIIGGATIALGLFMLLMEFLLCVTFSGIRFTGWSLYPLVALVLLGGMLIFLAICNPAREAVGRKFFL